MKRGKFRRNKVETILENRYYEVVFYTLLERTAESVKQDKFELLEKWCAYTETDFNILNRAAFKLGLSAYPHLKYLRMKALSYFGATIKQIKEMFNVTANYARVPMVKSNQPYNVTTEEEITEIKKIVDRLIELLYLFKYIKYDENCIVLKEYKDYNKQRVCELFIRIVLFYYNKRFKKLFPNRIEKATWALGKLLVFNMAEIDYINSKSRQYNNINIGEIRSLLYYAFDISLEDAKEIIPNTQQNLNYIHNKYKDKRYMPVLNKLEFEVVENFFKVIYDNTKYICCLKGVPNGK